MGHGSHSFKESALHRQLGPVAVRDAEFLGDEKPEEVTMTIEDVLEIWVPARLAEVLETSIQNVSGWLREGKIPRGRQYELQAKSGGRLIANTFDPSRDYVSDGRRHGRKMP